MPTKNPTHDVYWSLGSTLISTGLLLRKSRGQLGQGNLAVGAGLVILGVKLREWLAGAKRPS